MRFNRSDVGIVAIKMDPSLSLKNTPQHHPGHEYQGYTLPDEIPQSNYSDMSLFQGSMGIFFYLFHNRSKWIRNRRNKSSSNDG